MLLGVNIDHVATLRQARYAATPTSPLAEPSVIEAARLARAGGADSLTIHVREDRRHMQAEDAFELKKADLLPLNLEMAVTPAMTELACALQPTFACLVPEKREEVTTEGGLDVMGNLAAVRDCVSALREKGIRVSLFIDPETVQIEAAREVGAEMIELHTGCFANAVDAAQEEEIARLRAAARLGADLGLQVNAGHGLNYDNLLLLKSVRPLVELNIGHSIISRALTVGLEQAVREMKELAGKLAALSS